jgi:hypothetical protein
MSHVDIKAHQIPLLLKDILGNKDPHERDLFWWLHETGAEKGGRFQRGERKRQQDQNGTNNRPHEQ